MQAYCCFHKHAESQMCIHAATRREIKVTINVFIIVVFFTLCWLPLNIAKSVKILCTTCHVPDILITCGIILTHFNSAVNPLLYAYHLRDFRSAIVKLVGLQRRDSEINY